MNKITVISLIILVGIVFGISTLIKFSKIPAVVVEKTNSTTIDSIWYTTPGQENTLQTDFRYYGRTKNGQVAVSTSKPFNIGDTIECIYYRYENIKTEKKH